jgi:tRNA threonylcarbamoyladenosine biosynthesis protein TsaE
VTGLQGGRTAVRLPGMNDASLTFDLADDAETDRFGAALADWLQAGETLLLEGPIGAGKTHLARALIRARLGRMEDVPSPTFTLVQTYEADGAEIWHADLYRLNHVDEVVELGLEAAFGRAICLVEWPDRLGELAPEGAFHLTLSVQDQGRRARLSGPAGRLEALGHV